MTTGTAEQDHEDNGRPTDHNLEVDLIDRTQPVQFHQGWRRIYDGLQSTELVVRHAGQRRIAVVQPTKHQ